MYTFYKTVIGKLICPYCVFREHCYLKSMFCLKIFQKENLLCLYCYKSCYKCMWYIYFSLQAYFTIFVVFLSAELKALVRVSDQSFSCICFVTDRTILLNLAPLQHLSYPQAHYMHNDEVLPYLSC